VLHCLRLRPEYGEIAATKATAMRTLVRGGTIYLLWRLELIRSASGFRLRVG
jgi:hypothetical protein